MDRGLKSCNRVCYERDVLQSQRIHRRKIAAMKPTSSHPWKATHMDYNQPKTMGMSHLKAKSNAKWRREEELARIEKENNILMRKMDAIFAAGEGRSK